MEEKALSDGGWPFGYLSPVEAGEAQPTTADFVADDHPVSDQDVLGPLRVADSELKAA